VKSGEGMVARYDLWCARLFEHIRRALGVRPSELRAMIREVQDGGPRRCRARKCEYFWRGTRVRPLGKLFPKRREVICDLPACYPLRGKPIWRMDTALVEIAKREGIDWGDLWAEYQKMCEQPASKFIILGRR